MRTLVRSGTGMKVQPDVPLREEVNVLCCRDSGLIVQECLHICFGLCLGGSACVT